MDRYNPYNYMGYIYIVSTYNWNCTSKYIYIYWEYHKVKAKEFQDPKMGVPCPGAPGERRRARRACCKGTTCAAKIMKIWGSRGGLSGDVLKKISKSNQLGYYLKIWGSI